MDNRWEVQPSAIPAGLCPACETPYVGHTTSTKRAGDGAIEVVTACPVPRKYEVVTLGEVLRLRLTAEWEIVNGPIVYYVPRGGDHSDPLAEELIFGVKLEARRRA